MSLEQTSDEPKFPPGGSAAGDPLPPFVTFTSGAKLLQDLGLVDSITPDGLRYIARHDPGWRFGDGENQIPYVIAGRARTMETGVFLSMFEPPQPRRGGRGRKRGEAT